MEPYNVIVPTVAYEVMACDSAERTILPELLRHPTVKDVMVALADVGDVAGAQKKLSGWGVKSMVGHPDNVCARLQAAATLMAPQSFVVRMLLLNTQIPMEYVDAQVAYMRNNTVDFVTAPLDYNVTLCADVATVDSLKKIESCVGSDVCGRRALFNPFCYMDTNPDKFLIHMLEPNFEFSGDQIDKIAKNQRITLDRYCMGSASRYHYIVESGYVSRNMNVLDIACGEGEGTNFLSRHAAHVVGCDYLDSLIRIAKSEYPEHGGLQFMQGDGTTFYFNGGEYFDLIISLHTLEHVEDDAGMVRNLVRNLKPGGLLIVEVPILMKRPLGVPVVPSHLREYSPESLLALFDVPDLHVERIINACRGHYAEGGKLRESMRVHARKAA